MIPLVALHADAPQATALAEATRAVESARDALREDVKPSPEQFANLRIALEKALKSRSAALGRFHPGTLEAAGLWGAALHRAGGGSAAETERGDRIWARACADLQRGLAHQQRFHGPESRELLPHLEALEACFEAQGLNPWPFAERRLAIRIATTKQPSTELERGALAALKHAYGEFLTMRGPDIEGTLRWAEALAELWLRRPPAPGASDDFVQAAFRSDAQGVWKLLATHGGESLKAKVTTLLDRLDAADLARERGWAGIWARPLLETPWKDLATTQLQRVDRHVAARPGLEAHLLRVDLAEAEGAWERAASLLSEALREADPSTFRIVVDRCLDYLERDRSNPLLSELARAVAANPGALEDGAEIARGLAQALESVGRLEEAETLRRRVLSEAGIEGRLALARNLKAQGRAAEAVELFASLSGADPEAAPFLDFEWTSALLQAGRTEEARLRARAALARWSKDSLAVPEKCLGEALELLSGDPAGATVLVEAMQKLRRSFDLDESWIELQFPALIGALKAEARDHARGRPRDCSDGDPALPKEARALHLLSRFFVKGGRDDVPCLETALRLLGEAWHPADPRLVPMLKRVAEVLKESDPTKAEAALRRALDIQEGAPDVDPAQLLELRVLLGLHQLRQGRTGAGQRILQDAFDRGAAAFRANTREMDIAGSLFLALLQAFEAKLQYAQALDLAQRAAAVLAPLEGVPDDARRDLAALLRKLERQAKLQRLMGAAWPD